MRILALDMATATGWAAADTQDLFRIIRSGVWRYTNGKRPLELPVRLLNFKRDLNIAISDHGIDAILYEQAHHRGGPATRSALGMEAVVLMAAYERGLFCHGLHTSTLKKFATGNGRAEKDEMVRAANASMGGRKHVNDDNEADAINLLNWGGAHLALNKNGCIHVAVPQIKPKKTTRTTKEK